MNYLDVYFSRINHLGDTTAERIRNAGIRSFEKWLAQSPHTVRNLSSERGIYFNGIILTSKDKEYEKIMFLEVSNETDIVIGDILNWKLDNGAIEKWIVIQEEKKVNGTFRSFWIIRCNYLIKWVDENGHVKQSWSYIVSSLDSKIKGNFRTWNNLITPQPNKYTEILMPKVPISRATNFIVEEESWSVIEYDHTSVPGVIYLSLTENKINSIYDDIINNIADTDKIANYTLSMPEETQIFKINEPIDLKFTLMKNGLLIDEPVVFISGNNAIARNITVLKEDPITGERIKDTNLIAVGTGATEITVQLKNYPDISIKVPIEVSTEDTNFMGYIEGNTSIRLDRSCEYELKGTTEILGEVNYTLQTTNLAQIIALNDNKCTIKANNKNLLGTIVLQAEYNNEIYTKDISIIPLW